ncbi:MAG: hypothetical protein WC462_00875 [archaeon]
MKGFFGFALCLAMMLILVLFGSTIQKEEEQLEKIQNELIIAEQANKEKTLLENNTDKIIKIKLTEQAENKNFKTAKAQNEINTALENYLRGKAIAATIFGEKIGEPTKEFLKENSNVMILQTNGSIYAEYVFTSSTLKNTTISSRLGNKIITHFEIPAGHTTRIIN